METGEGPLSPASFTKVWIYSLKLAESQIAKILKMNYEVDEDLPGPPGPLKKNSGAVAITKSSARALHIFLYTQIY